MMCDMLQCLVKDAVAIFNGTPLTFGKVFLRWKFHFETAVERKVSSLSNLKSKAL